MTSISLQPSIKINWSAGFPSAMVILLSFVASSERKLIMFAGAFVILILGQLVQAWEARRASRLGGVLLEDDALIVHGERIQISGIDNVSRVRSGVLIRLGSGKTLGISAFVYSNAAMNRLELALASMRAASMAEVRLTTDEVEVLRLVLSAIHIRTRTGEIGITHGADRFVSTNICLRKPQKESLDHAFAKLGLVKGPTEAE